MTYRAWKRPQVKVGGHYRVGDATVEVSALGPTRAVLIAPSQDGGVRILAGHQEDDATELVLLYLESLGNPRRYFRIARRFRTPAMASVPTRSRLTAGPRTITMSAVPCGGRGALIRRSPASAPRWRSPP